MPIYEFECPSCKDSFEVLVRSDLKISCPDCGSAEVTKKFSPFASYVKQSDEFSPSCRTDQPGCNPGKCGSGMCGVE